MSRKLRLVHINPNMSWGGAEIYMLQLASWQKAAGLDITIWCKEGSPIHQDTLRRGLQVITDFVPMRRPLFSLFHLAQMIKRESFTDLQIHWSGGVMTFAGIKMFCAVRTYYHTHMFMAYPKNDPFHWLAYRSLNKIYMAGEKAKQIYLQNLPIKENQIQIIPYGLDLTEAKSYRTDQPPYEKWGLPKGPRYFGFFGRLDRQKGTKEFLLAALPLMDQFPDLHLLVVGDPTKAEEDSIKYQAEIAELIAKTKHQNRIHVFGHQKEFLSLLSCLELLVMPSYQETYSILIINSFALGIPVLSTNDGGTPDLIGTNEERGFLVPPKQVKPLQEKMQLLLKNPSEIQKRKSVCIEYVEKMHDHNRITEAYSKSYWYWN